MGLIPAEIVPWADIDDADGGPAACAIRAVDTRCTKEAAVALRNVRRSNVKCDILTSSACYSCRGPEARGFSKHHASGLILTAWIFALLKHETYEDL